MKCGAEAAIHSLQNSVDALGDDGDYALLSDDYENAFNLVDHQILLDEVSDHFPSLLYIVSHMQTIDTDGP